jgi:hypothetical protein
MLVMNAFRDNLSEDIRYVIHATNILGCLPPWMTTQPQDQHVVVTKTPFEITASGMTLGSEPC